MIRFLGDFVRRWKWLLLVQLLVSGGGWAFKDKSNAALVHLEFGVAVAMSWDLMRGLNRACLAWPLTSQPLARGMWLAVAGVGPLVSCLAVLPGTLVCLILGRSLPSPHEFTLHMLLSLLLAGTLQFVLTGLRSRIAPTWGGKIRDGFFGLLWGLSLSATGWLGLVIPSSWETLRPAGMMIMSFMAVVTVISWFTTPGMVISRAARAVSSTPAPGRSPAEEDRSFRNSLLHGASGWRVWLGMELRWQFFIPLMVLLVMGSLRLIGRLGPSGAEATVVGGPNQYTALGMLCAMLVVPMFSISVGPQRAFAALPVRRVFCALLMALRPPVYALIMFAAYLLLTALLGQPNTETARAACLFGLIGSVTGLLQSFLIRWPNFGVAVSLGMVLAPASILLLPVLFKPGISFLWMPVASAGILVLAGVLHLHGLRTSSRIYGSMPWLQRNALGGAAR
ncbi:MAG: hypothetical protein V4726_17605 [Verrucomicrobiota bacterium]